MLLENELSWFAYKQSNVTVYIHNSNQGENYLVLKWMIYLLNDIFELWEWGGERPMKQRLVYSDQQVISGCTVTHVQKHTHKAS